MYNCCHCLRGQCGLKSVLLEAQNSPFTRHCLRGQCGLKSMPEEEQNLWQMSLPARAVWIEMK